MGIFSCKKRRREKSKRMMNVQVTRIRYGFMISRCFSDSSIVCYFYRLVSFINRDFFCLLHENEKLQNTRRFHNAARQTWEWLNATTNASHKSSLKTNAIAKAGIIHKLSSRDKRKKKYRTLASASHFSFVLSAKIAEDIKQGFLIQFYLRLGAIFESVVLYQKKRKTTRINKDHCKKTFVSVWAIKVRI